MGIRALVAALATITLVVLATVTAAASCVPDERPVPVEVTEAEIVFVGTVLDVENSRRTARMRIEEIWKGPELGEQVVVHGGPEDASASSVDRHWEPGARYLVFPRRDDGRLEDDVCSPTTPWEPQLATFRPDDAGLVEAEPGRVISKARPTEWVFGGVAAVVLLIGTGWLVARHVRRPPLRR